MTLKVRKIYILILIVLMNLKLSVAQSVNVINSNLQYCTNQASKTLKNIPTVPINIPRSILKDSSTWKYVDYKDWCSGFWPGILWYEYEFTKEESWKIKADSFSRLLTPLAFNPAYDHDLGFQMYCSFGNGYRLTKDTSYKRILIAAADTLASLFNPKVGTILSWPREVNHFGAHNTIMDNMMNLELLFWASKNGGNSYLYNIAVRHATTTMKNHFRKDYSGYHVVLYDTITGKKINGITHQGYSDSSMWARGQSWAIYGFTMVYRETKDPQFLDFAQKVTDVYLQRLPKDLIPFWDFNDPAIPNTPKDASAACVVASALLELSTFVPDKNKAEIYRNKAEQMLTELSFLKYQSRSVNDAFLLHSAGHKPNGGEIDASIIYADYYYMEALLRDKKLKKGKSIYENL